MTIAGQDSDGYATQIFELCPVGSPSGAVIEEIVLVLSGAVHHALMSNEQLIVERGGWDASDEPFCLLMSIEENGCPEILIATSPEPRGSGLWAPHIETGEGWNCLISAVSQEAVDMAPIAMVEAMRTWGVEPWDLTLSFRPR